MIFWFGLNISILFVYGIEVQGTYSLLTATLPSLIYFWIVAKDRGGRFFFTFCLVDTIMIWVMMVTGLIDYAVGSEGLVNFILRMICFSFMLPFTYITIIRFLNQQQLNFEMKENQRYITCKCINSPCLMLEFSNPYKGNISFSSDGLPTSSKNNHGTGTRSIKAFAEKYNAICSFKTRNGIFILQLAINTEDTL